MKRRILVAALIALALVIALGVLAYGYTVTQISGEVTVKEPLTLAQSTFTLSAYPGENYTLPISIKNDASVLLAVKLTAQASGPFALTLRDTQVTVPPKGSYYGYLNVSLPPSAPPGVYTFRVLLER